MSQGVNRYTFTMSARCRLRSQLRKYRCVAANVETGQQRTSQLYGLRVEVTPDDVQLPTRFAIKNKAGCT